MACEKLRPHRKFVGCEAQRFTRDRFRHAIELKQNIAGPHGCDPRLGLAFTLTHARFRWTRRYWFIWENTDPQFSFALHVASERDAGGFQLCVGDPRALECLQTKLAKINPEIARSSPLSTPTLGFPILHAFWHQWHKDSPKPQPARVAAVAARQVERALRQAALLFYKSNISHRSCRKPCWPQQNRSQSACVACAVEFSLPGTIPNAKSQRRSVDRRNGS